MKMLATLSPLSPLTPESMGASPTPHADMIDEYVAESIATLRTVFQLEETSHEHPNFRSALDVWVESAILADETIVDEDPATLLAKRIEVLESLEKELVADGEDQELIAIAQQELAICKGYRRDAKLGRITVVDSVHIVEPETGFYL